MSCNYCWNQPKKYERYDLYLDGKIKADDFVYRTKDESGEIITTTLSEKIDEIESRLETHFTFNTDYATITDLESAFNNGELKDTVIYIVKNETVSDNPDSRDSYNEYMVVTVKDEEGNETKTLELIGSGSYAKQQADLDKEIADRIADVNAEEKRAMEKEALIDAELAKRIPYTLQKSVNVVGNIKDVVKLDVPESSNEAMYCPQGLIMGGNAADAGLVTRGICGIGAVDNNGGCSKENLYINYDGNNITTYNPKRQLVLQAGVIGEQYTVKLSDTNTKTTNLYQYAAARGDAVKDYVDATVGVEKSRSEGIENELKGRIDTLVGQNLNSRLASIEGLDLANVIATVSELQSKIDELEATIEQLKNYNTIEEPENGDVTEPTDPETPTE